VNCEKCNKKKAVLHLTKVVDGEVKKLHLCDECAKELGYVQDNPLSIEEVMLGTGETSSLSHAPNTPVHCATCGMTMREFKKRARLGCPDCYTTFENELAPLLKSMHRKERHVGKIPSHEGPEAVRDAGIRRLEERLKSAIADEHYEEAAELRDQLQQARAPAEGEGVRHESR